jgi:hypothetical protein
MFEFPTSSHPRCARDKGRPRHEMHVYFQHAPWQAYLDPHSARTGGKEFQDHSKHLCYKWDVPCRIFVLQRHHHLLKIKTLILTDNKDLEKG